MLVQIVGQQYMCAPAAPGQQCVNKTILPNVTLFLSAGSTDGHCTPMSGGIAAARLQEERKAWRKVVACSSGVFSTAPPLQTRRLPGRQPPAAAALQPARTPSRLGPILQDHPFGYVARPEAAADGSTDIFTWKCLLPGKEGTLWEGGLFPLTLAFTSGAPPAMIGPCWPMLGHAGPVTI